MSAFNYRLHDAVLENLADAVVYETDNLANDREADYGALKLRIGRILGLKDAIAIAEETRKTIQET